jgi:hypothetical protein
MSDSIFKCIILTDSQCKKKKSRSKYYIEALRQHLHITLLKDRISLKLFINVNPLNNAIFINIQQTMGDMISVIPTYIAIYTDAYISVMYVKFKVKFTT